MFEKIKNEIIKLKVASLQDLAELTRHIAAYSDAVRTSSPGQTVDTDRDINELYAHYYDEIHTLMDYLDAHTCSASCTRYVFEYINADRYDIVVGSMLYKWCVSSLTKNNPKPTESTISLLQSLLDIDSVVLWGEVITAAKKYGVLPDSYMSNLASTLPASLIHFQDILHGVINSFGGAA